MNETESERALDRYAALRDECDRLRNRLLHAETEREELREQSEWWRTAYGKWIDWAAETLSALGLQPEGGQHGSGPAREILSNRLLHAQADAQERGDDVDRLKAELDVERASTRCAMAGLETADARIAELRKQHEADQRQIAYLQEKVAGLNRSGVESLIGDGFSRERAEQWGASYALGWGFARLTEARSDLAEAEREMAETRWERDEAHARIAELEAQIERARAEERAAAVTWLLHEADSAADRSCIHRCDALRYAASGIDSADHLKSAGEEQPDG